MIKLPRVVGGSLSALAYLAIVTNTFAQSATNSAPKGGTSGSLPSAGSTDITYMLFIFGIVLFVFGTLKLVTSFKEA